MVVPLVAPFRTCTLTSLGTLGTRAFVPNRTCEDLLGRLRKLRHLGVKFPSPLDPRTELSDNWAVKGAEFERRVRRLARQMNVACTFVATEGKGSHGRLYFGEEFTTLKDRRKEIGRDLFAKMCRDLKIDPHEL
jgi:mRNA interferase HicA